MTKQISEILIYEGKEFELHSELGNGKRENVCRSYLVKK